MTAAELVAWLADPAIAQREKLAIMRSEQRATIRALADDDFVRVLREARKRLNSPKLVAERDALLEELAHGRAANPRPVAEPVVEPPPPVPAGTPMAEVLAAAIEHNAEGQDGYLVLGDFLHEQNDPRGELIAIGVALAKNKGDHKLLASHADHLAEHPELLGPLRSCLDVITKIDWHCGFIRGCTVHYTIDRFNAPSAARRKPGDIVDVAIPDVIGWLLDEPGPGRFLQHLVVGLVRHDANNYDGVAAVLARRVRPTLRSLMLGDFDRDECELNWSTIGDLSALWPAVPNLTKLWLRSGAMGLAGIHLPRLEELQTITGGLSASSARAIADAAWPALVRLSLQYGPESDAGIDDVMPLLAGDKLPKLRHLGITNFGDTDAVCEALPKSGMLPQLAELDLSMGTMSERGLAVLLREAKKLAHLARIDVDDNYLPEAAHEQLVTVLPNLYFGRQRVADEDEPRHASAFE